MGYTTTTPNSMGSPFPPSGDFTKAEISSPFQRPMADGDIAAAVTSQTLVVKYAKCRSSAPNFSELYRGHLKGKQSKVS